MASQGIWVGSFLVFGLLLQVSKGGFVGYHLITNGENLYEAQHQQKTTQSQLGVFNAVGTTGSSKQLNPASTANGLLISKLIPGLEGYTSQNADHKTSSWNQNQYTNRTTTEATLGESNRLNTTHVPGDLAPVIASKGFLIHKSVLGQDINDVINPGYEVTDGRRGSQKHVPLSQHQDLTTAESQFGAFHRINTTDASNVIYPVTNNQSQNRTTTEPHLEIVEKMNTSDAFEEFGPASTIQAQSGTGTKSRLTVLDKLNITDAFEKLDPETNNQTQTNTKTESQLAVFDRSITNNVSGVFEPEIENYTQNRTITEPELGVFDRINTTGVYEESGPAEKYQDQNLTATEPQLQVFDKTNTTKVFEEFQPVEKHQDQNLTATEPQLQVFDKTNTTKVFEEFQPAEKHQDQNLTATEPQLQVFDKTNTTKVFEEFQPVEKHQDQNLTATEPQLQVFDKTNTTKVFEEFEPDTNNQASNRTAIYTKLGVLTRINTTDVSEKFEPEKNNQDQNRTPNKIQLGIFDKINTTDLYEESELVTNNQVQNRTIIESLLGVFERINTTDVSETSEPAGNNQTHDRTVTAAQLGVFSIINTTDISEKSEPGANNHTQERKIIEPQLVVFDRINTTDVPKKFDPVGNFKGVVFNKLEHEQKMSNDITAEGHTVSNGNNVGDTSLLLNQTKNRITTVLRLGAFDTVNATDVANALEPISKYVGVVMNQSVSGQEIQNATAIYGNGHLRELVKQGVTQLQSALSQGTDNQTTQTNGSVTTKHSLVTKQNESKGKMQVQSINRKKKVNKVAQTTNSKKLGQQKGHTVIKAEKGNRNSPPKPRAQNRNNTHLGTFDRANTTNITDEFHPVTKVTGEVLSQLVPGQEVRKDTLIQGKIIMDQKVRYTSLSPNQTQNGTTAESRLGVIDRITTADIQDELESVANSTGLAVNESVPGVQRQNDSMFSGHNIIERENISDASLSQNQTQNRTTVEPYLGTLNKVNTTRDPEGSKPITNFTSVAVDPLVPGKEIHNATLRSATDIGSKLIKQGITKKPDKRGANKAEGNVRIVNIVTTKGKDLKAQVQLHASVRKKQRNEQAKAKSDIKQGNGTLSRLIKQGTTKLQAFESGAKETETRGGIVNTLATKGSDLNGLMHSVISKKQGKEQVKAKTDRKQGDTVINPNEVSLKYVSTTRPQHRTTKETTPLGSFNRVIASDVTYELKLATNSTDQPVPRQEMNKDAFILARTISIHKNVSVTFASQNQTQNLTTKESSLEPFNRVNTTGDIEELESVANTTGVGINESGSEQIRKDELLPAPTKNIYENASDASLSTNQTQNWTTEESGLGPLYRVKNPDDVEELESLANSTGLVINESLSGRQIRKDTLFSAPTKNIHENASDASLSTNQTQNWTTEESGLVSLYRVINPDHVEELESLANSTGLVINESLSGRQIRKDTLFSAHTASIRELDNDTSVPQQVSQNQTTKESHLETFYRVNTTEHIEEFESLVNTTGVGINETLSGRQILKDVLFSGHTTGNPEKFSDTSLSPNQSQIRTTKEPRTGAFGRANTTNAPEAMEPVNNFNQPIPGQERNNATIKPGNKIMSILTTQRVTTLQVAESGAHQANGSVRIVNTMVMKENDTKSQVQLDTTIRKKQKTKPTKAKNSKKQSRRKSTDHKRSKN